MNDSSEVNNEAVSARDQKSAEVKTEQDTEVDLTKKYQNLAEIKKKLSQCSQILSKGENVTYCSVDGLDSGLPLVPDENGVITERDSAPNDIVVQKFGQEFYPESVIPGFYTWFQGDGSVVRYVMDFVMYTYRGDRFVPLEHLGRYETKILMFCKIKHVGMVHTAEDLLETNHPWSRSFKNKKRVELSEGLLKVPRKQRFFSSKVVLVDWYFDVGTTEDSTPHIWVVSDNEVHYKLDRPTGGYYNAFSPAKLLFDLSTRVVKEMQSGEDKSFNDVLVSMTTPSNYYKNSVYRALKAEAQGLRNGEAIEELRSEKIKIEDTEELTVWGAPVNVHGSTLVDVYRNLDFIFNECRYYYTFFGAPDMEIYLNELVQRLKDQSPFHYFDSNFMNLDYVCKNALANKYKDHLFVQVLDYPSAGTIIKPLKLSKLAKRGQKTKKFNLEEYNNQYNMNDVKSRSGRVIRNKAVSEIEPAVRKHVVQTESQRKEEYRKAVELEAKCDGLLLPFDFEWSNYNTCSEASDNDTSTPVLCNDVDVELNNAKYYPRDIPLRTLKFYGTDEIVDLLDLTRHFSVTGLNSLPLLPKMSFMQLETNLIFTTSLVEYRPTDLCPFLMAPPQCLCNNRRFNSIYDDINRSAHFNFYMYNNEAGPSASEAAALSARDQLKDLMPDDEEFEDGMQWIYYLNKNIIDESDLEYPEDLDEGSVGRLYVGLLEELRRSVENSGFDWFVQNLRESGELSDKKKEVQERELGIAISDADIALDFINTNGGCLYKGRFRRIGPDPDSILPYVNSSRWNKRFKKFQRVVTVSGNYRYSTISHSHDADGFTVFDSNRPKNCPVDLIYGSDLNFKTVQTEGDSLPTFKRSLNVWKKEPVYSRKSNNQLRDSVNHYINYFNRFVKSYVGAKLKPNKRLEANTVDLEYYVDFLVDGVDDMLYEPILGFGYREYDTISQSEYLLADEMLTEYTWHPLLKLYLFYGLYSPKTSYKFKFNSVVWGDPSFFNTFSQGVSQDDQKPDSQKPDYTYDEEMIDTEKFKMLDEIAYDDFENSNSGIEEEDQSKDDEEDEEEEEEVDEPDEGGEDKDRVGRRGWGINRYCPYYEFEMEWHPDADKLDRLSRGKIGQEFIKEAFMKLRTRNFFQLELQERLSLLLWLGDILGYSATGKNFIDERNDEFYYLKTQLMRAEDDKKGPKRQKGSSKELSELEDRYAQKPVLLGHDRFYNAYYYFGLEYERRVYVQTMPQLRFVQSRMMRRIRFLRKPSYKSDMFRLDLSEFAQKFSQDRIFMQTKGKRGRKKEVHDDTGETTGKRRRKNQSAKLQALNGSEDSSMASTKTGSKILTNDYLKGAKAESTPVNSNDSANMTPSNSESTPINQNVPSSGSSSMNASNNVNSPESGINGMSSNPPSDQPTTKPEPSVTNGHRMTTIKREESSRNGMYRDMLDGYMKGSLNDDSGKDDEAVRRRRIKNRSRNRPKVRRSRQVFDRRPTNFKTVDEYLHYLINGPARLSWCVIDSHKTLKRFITRLSQFTTNERNLALKLAQIEPDFTLPTFEILTYKCPTVIGEMLMALLRGLYRYYKNVFTKMVLSSVVVNNVVEHYKFLAEYNAMKAQGQETATPTNLNEIYTHANPYQNVDSSSHPLHSSASNGLSDPQSNTNPSSPTSSNSSFSHSTTPLVSRPSISSMSGISGFPSNYPYFAHPSSPDKLIHYKVASSYNNGLFMNLYVNDLLKTCLSLCISDLEGNKKCFKMILEIIYLFEFVANRYYFDERWMYMRNEWKMNIDSIYSLLRVDLMTTRRSNQPKAIMKVQGDHNSNCFVYNNTSTSNNILSAIISTPSGNIDLISLVERAGLWFRFFEVYNRDTNTNFDISTSVNYSKFMANYNNQLTIKSGPLRKNFGVKSNNLQGFTSESQKLEIDLLGLNEIELFSFLGENKVGDSMVFFSGGLLELINTLREMIKKLNELLGIKVLEEISKPKGTKSRGKKKKKKKDKDEESDSALTDVESNLDPNDMYQDAHLEIKEVKEETPIVSMDDQSAPITPQNVQKPSLSQESNEDLIMSENYVKDEFRDLVKQEQIPDSQPIELSVPNSQQESVVNITKMSQVEEPKLESGEKRYREEKAEKPKRAKKTKTAKNGSGDEALPQEDEESSNEIDPGQKDKQHHSHDTNNEEVLEPIKKLLAALEIVYQNAPKETCQVKILNMSTNLIKVKLPTKSEERDDGEMENDNENEGQNPKVSGHEHPHHVNKPADQNHEKDDSALEILVLNLTVSSPAYDIDSEDEEDELDENLGFTVNLRRVARVLGRIEKTRSTKRAAEEAPLSPKALDSSPPRMFKLLVPVVVKTLCTAQFPQYLYSYTKVFNGLTYFWRASIKCKNLKTNQTGVIRRTNYTSPDIWKCVLVEWSDNKKEQVAHNLWELTL